MTRDEGKNNEDTTPPLSPLLSVPGSANSDQPIRLPKIKSTSSLCPVHHESLTVPQRTRFSFDAGTTSELTNLKRASRVDHDHGLGRSGLRRIRRQGAIHRTPTLVLEEPDFVPGNLQHSSTAPVSGLSSRSVSTSHLMSGPASPLLENVHRFPSESLHSFSFAKQSEELLHSRQSILQKSVDFVRDRSAWAANPALADAQARVSGNAEIQGMMDLLKKANIIPIDTGNTTARSIGTGPLTGPAHHDGRNVFEKSFSQELEQAQEAEARTHTEDMNTGRKFSLEEDDPFQEQGLEMRIPPTRADSMDGPRKPGLRRTYTDVNSVSLQQKLIEALAQPYSTDETSLAHSAVGGALQNVGNNAGVPKASAVHGHGTKWEPAHQAVFRTEADAPWTILAANDLACLIFGVTRAEVRSLSILALIQEERRHWLEKRLARSDEAVEEKPRSPPSSGAGSATSTTSSSLSFIGSRSGITARLLSKAPSRANTSSEKAKTSYGSSLQNRPKAKNHPSNKSRGVLLCGDIVPIQKRDGTRGAASFWVMEKRGGLIWVIEEITEDVSYLELDETGTVERAHGDYAAIWGRNELVGLRLSQLLPKFPLEALNTFDKHHLGYFTAQTADFVNVPTTVEKAPTKNELRVSSLPHIAGVMILDPSTLKITNANSIFAASLFGYKKPDGLPISDLIPSFGDMLKILCREDGVELVDGIVVPEHSFRRARALLALREGKESASNIFLRPCGLPARHRDGSDIMVDVQMRVIRSETVYPMSDEAIIEEKDEVHYESSVAVAELVYAVWVIYSRNLHSAGFSTTAEPEPEEPSRPPSPPSQPDPPPALPSPPASLVSRRSAESSDLSLQTDLVPDGASIAMEEPLEHPPPHTPYVPHEKKSISDFTVLEEMGSGAYGQVKLVRYKKAPARKMVVKYVTKKRILVDTWTRDRRLGTVPLEIHVLDYLRRDGLRHPNIVEMIDFFEDDVNYYIEMLPHGIPGMDLFDYIELRTNMTEAESRNIFRQVVDAIHHLHTKALVVHRDIKDENVVLDGEGQIKLIDFGSAAYIKNGPFEVFVGTIDYAAPEVLQGKPYGGKEQDVWALGILLYTIAYKENPFYNLDEILDHPLRVPFLPYSEECLELIRKMLDRDVERRITIEDVRNHPWLQEDF
ncbi:Serine/threonine-protein kinase ppk6 [Exophiala dermatitidis]|uniref:non-specific serine/threonine protein kinase n=1 Tax=Exophiala dermatitidis (strain ATCC 34100 / CBS 525.76 / NIH/UT8656) TaxID=858893 RepID=H6BK19_EXODN|nr:protein-serine/threonine kinase [Exophiala dermatitidis NIH/UT8656]EHY52473.1 protein-serine/threonine kinase [Exophiala dermatitidis NIH/UT8656]